jgi:transcriptional regulator with XRE-family HTH domain
MSPRPRLELRSDAANRALSNVVVGAAEAIGTERLRRCWTLAELASRAGVSIAAAQRAETGAPVSLETYVRLATALGLRASLMLEDRRRRQSGTGQDVVHAAMGEFEAGHFRRLGFEVAVDEPYQHFQFAGRADILAWDRDTRALLHLENRTRFPNLQDVAGSYNAKRAYLASAFAGRLGLSGRWRSVTHALVALWSSEVLHALRLRTETFRSLCPDQIEGFAGWWAGAPPASGETSTFVVLDPLAGEQGPRRRLIDLDAALRADPRYATTATRAR